MKLAVDGPVDQGQGVAPHAGAWIETGDDGLSPWLRMVSHPTRVRGLKRHLPIEVTPLRVVAPHAGAWIEPPLPCV